MNRYFRIGTVMTKIIKSTLWIVFLITNACCNARICHDLFDIIKAYIPENPIIIEAGAENGEDTIKISTWPTATIYAFEPLPQSYNELVYKASPYENIFCFPLAISDFIGKHSFYVGIHHNGASSLLKPNPIMNGFISFYTDPTEVYSTTFDCWAKKIT